MQPNKYNNIEVFQKEGFTGFIPISELRNSLHVVPQNAGVYVVLLPPNFQANFSITGTGGFFRDRDPNVPIETLKQKWVDNTILLYVGQSSNNLQVRIKTLIAFGHGNKIGHWAGRFIWQLENSDQLLIAWKVTGEFGFEQDKEFLLNDFHGIYNRFPFANLKEGSLKEDILNNKTSLEPVFMDQVQLKKHLQNLFNVTRDNNPRTFESHFIILSYIFIKRVFEARPDNIIFSSQEILIKYNKFVSRSFHTKVDQDLINEYYLLLTDVFQSNGISIPSFIAWSQNDSLAKLLKDVIFYLDGISFNNESVNPYQFGLVFNNFIEDLFNGRDSFSTTHKALRYLMASLLDPNPYESIYDPAVGVGSILVELKDFINYEQTLEVRRNFFGQEVNSSIYSILLMNMLINRISQDGFLEGDTIINPRHINAISDEDSDITYGFNRNFTKKNNTLKKFDKIISELPFRTDKIVYDSSMAFNNNFFGISPTNYDDAFILHSISSLNNNGKAVVVIAPGFLYKKNNDIVRQLLVENDLIEAVIQLPYGLFSYTQIQPTILIINKAKPENKVGKVYFVDHKRLETDISSSEVIEKIINLYSINDESNEASRIITREEIRQNNYSLEISRYSFLRSELLKLVENGDAKRLKDICVIKRGIKLKSINVGEYLIPFISTSDLFTDITHKYFEPDTFRTVESDSLEKTISAQSVIISLIGDKLKPVIHEPKFDFKNIFIDSNVAALFPNEKLVDIEYLYYQFYRIEILDQISSLKKGAGIPFVSLNDLGEIIIPLPSLENQSKYIAEQKRTLLELEELRYKDRIKDLDIKKSEVSGQEETIKILSHNLLPNISNINTIANSLKYFLERRNLLAESLIEIDSAEIEDNLDIIDDAELIYPHETVADSLNRLHGYLDYIIGLISRTKEYVLLKLTEEDFSEYNLKDLLDKYIDDKKAEYGSLYDFIVKCPFNLTASIHKDTFLEIFNQLIRNTHIHAFEDSYSGKRVIQINVYPHDEFIKIGFSNNGKKFDLTESEYFRMGSKGNYSKGMGLGGYHVKRIVDEHGGKIEIDSESKGMRLIMTFSEKTICFSTKR